MSSNPWKPKSKSGAQKRKEKKEQQKRILSSTSPLETYFSKTSQTSQVDETESKDSEPPNKIRKSTPDKTGSMQINELGFLKSIQVDSGNTETSNKKSINEEEQSIHEQASNNAEYFTYATSSAFKSSGVSADMFWRFHPQQPMHNVPFTAKKVFFRIGPDGKEVNRKWVTYDNENKKLHCSFCLMYAPAQSCDSKWVQGYSSFEHIRLRLTECEKSTCHTTSTEAYLINVAGKTIENSMLQEQSSLRKIQILERRTVLSCIIDIVFYIGIQALPFRSKQENLETALDKNQLENCGNFMELVKLLAEYNQTLKNHLDKALRKVKQLKPAKKGKKGRGKVVTFLSNNSVNKLFGIIGDMIKETISNEVKEAGQYSVQLDSTQDISTHDQCSIVVRYVLNDTAKEKLL